jgi:AmmeMemoRadiSam system protein B
MMREPAVAGTFYPGDADELLKMVQRLLKEAGEAKLEGRLRGLVVPHAGYEYSGPVAACGYRLLQKQGFEKAIIIGPSHYATFYGACEAGADFWKTPLGAVKAVSAAARAKAMISVYPEVHAHEHCLEVQLPFLQAITGKFEVWPVLCGMLDPAELAEVVARETDGGTVVIASSDLSHYNAYERAVKIDATANEAVPALDIKRFEKEGDACGKSAILALMHLAKKKGWKGKLVDYRNSGDTAGPKSEVVGYGCYAFCEGKK